MGLRIIRSGEMKLRVTYVYADGLSVKVGRAIVFYPGDYDPACVDLFAYGFDLHDEIRISPSALLSVERYTESGEAIGRVWKGTRP